MADREQSIIGDTNSNKAKAALLSDAVWAGSSPLMIEASEFYPQSAIDLSVEMLATEDGKSAFGHERLVAEVARLELRSHFLGIRFEKVYQAALKASARFHLQRANWQVQQAGHTFGEFDVLLRSGDTVIHQELAVKFYLGLPVDAGVEQPRTQQTWAWFGPELRDRLDMKLALLTQQQLRLSSTPEGKAALSGIGINSVRSELVMKGYLFYPLVEQARISGVRRNLLTEISGASASVAADHLRGYWTTLNGLSALDEVSSRWSILPKTEWLRPARRACEDCHELEHIVDFLSLPGKLERPVMLARQSSNETRAVFEENLRCFVVDNGWASRASRSLVAA